MGSLRWMALVRETGLDLLALLWPTECVACGAADRDCCAACLAALRAPAPVLERRVGDTVVYAAGNYEGPLRALLVACKHEGRTGFVRDLGAKLRFPLRVAMRGAGGVLLVPAPSRPARVRERGFRHIEMILAVARPHAPVVRALRATRGRTGQVGLDIRERERNARRVAVRRSVRSRLRGRDVVLVDDIVTTGATAAAACAALCEAGAHVVAVVALCVVERRTGGADAVNSEAGL